MANLNSQSFVSDGQESSILDLKELLRLVKRNRRFVLIMSLAFFLLGLIFAFLKPPVYQSTALIEIKGAQGSVSDLMAVLGSAAPASLGSLGGTSTSPSDIEVSLLRSRYILGNVIRELGLNLVAHPYYFPFIGHAFNKFYYGKQPAAPFLGLRYYSWGGGAIHVSTFEMPETLEGLSFSLQARSQTGYVLYAPNGVPIIRGEVGKLENSKNANFPVSIKVSALSAREGSRFIIKKQAVDIMVGNILNHLKIQERGERTGVLALQYSAKTPIQAQTILNTILAVAVTKNTHEKSAEAAKTLAFLKKQMPGLSQQLTAAEKAVSRYSEKTGMVDEKIDAEVLLQNLNTLEQSLEQTKLKKLQLLQDFTSKHPYVISVEAQEKQLQSRIDQVEKQLRNVPNLNQGLVNLQRNLEVTGDLYKNTEMTIQQMQMLKAGTLSDVRLLSGASYPVFEMPRKMLLISLASLFFGFVLAMIILVFRQLLSPNVENPEAIEEAIQLPVLAVLPYCAREAQIRKSLKKVVLGVAHSKKSFLLAEDDPKNVTTEALRSMRTALGIMMVGKKCPIIAISGVSPNAGKSFVSANLAYLFASLGKRVLLLDSDMRKGHLNQYFALQASPGMAELLDGKLMFSDVLHKNVAENLDFIAAGTRPSHPAELLSGSNISVLLADYSNQYDYIFMDTPPVLAVSDSLIILKHTTHNVLIIGAGTDNMNEIRHTKKTFDKANVQLHGVALNHTTKRSHESHAGRYSYNYDYKEKA